MKRDRYLELDKMTMEELMHPSVSMSEFNFMLENVGKKLKKFSLKVEKWHDYCYKIYDKPIKTHIMDKKNFTLIESILTGTSDSYKYENYVEWCEDNEMEPQGKDSDDYWQWVSDQVEIDYDCFFDNLHYAKAEHGYYMITFNLGLWNGHRIGYVEHIYTSLTEAIKAALNSSNDYWDYKVVFENGNVVVYGYHHDGTNIMTIRQLSKHGQRNLLDKDEPNYDKYVQLKDTFKKLDWQFAWT